MALFDRNKPFIGSRIYDYVLEIWERFDGTPTSSQLDTVSTVATSAASAASAAQTTANNAASAASGAQTTANSATSAASAAQTTANNAASAASGAQTTANSATSAASAAQTTANSANYNASQAMGILGGQADFFYGEYSFTGTPSNLAVPSWSAVIRSGINYDSGFFNFSYLGKYEIVCEMSGDCVNSRADWYQEITSLMRRNALGATDQLTGSTRLPPSGTWNQRFTGSTVITVASGDQWRALINMTSSGTTSNGKLKIWVKKLV